MSTKVHKGYLFHLHTVEVVGSSPTAPTIVVFLRLAGNQPAKPTRQLNHDHRIISEASPIPRGMRPAPSAAEMSVSGGQELESEIFSSAAVCRTMLVVRDYICASR